MAKDFSGNTPSRPITYIKRALPACAAIPEANTVTHEKTKIMDWKNAPATNLIMSGCVSLMFLKRETSGKNCCKKNDTVMKIIPPISAVRKIARGITLPAFGVSSDRELNPSKPKNEKQSIVAPAIRGSIPCAHQQMVGRSKLHPFLRHSIHHESQSR